MALIAGRPMIQHVYERAVSCHDVEAVYVATDDVRIMDCVKGFGGNAVMTDRKHRSGTDRVHEAAVQIGLNDEDLVVNIQGDQPLFHPSVVSDLTRSMAKDVSISMATLKIKIKEGGEIHNPNQVKLVADASGFALYFSRYAIPFYRDDEPHKRYYRHVGIYGYRMAFLTRFTRLPEGTLEAAEKLEQLRALEHGFKIKVVEISHESIEVDVPEDVEKVEQVLRRYGVSNSKTWIKT